MERGDSLWVTKAIAWALRQELDRFDSEEYAQRGPREFLEIISRHTDEIASIIKSEGEKPKPSPSYDTARALKIRRLALELFRYEQLLEHVDESGQSVAPWAVASMLSRFLAKVLGDSNSAQWHIIARAWREHNYAVSTILIPREVPFYILYAPRGGGVLFLANIAHEVGHVWYREKSMNSVVNRAILAAGGSSTPPTSLNTRYTDSTVIRRMWRDWVEEIACDMAGLVLTGPANAFSAFAHLSLSKEHPETPDDSHPSPMLRLRMMQHLVKEKLEGWRNSFYDVIPSKGQELIDHQVIELGSLWTGVEIDPIQQFFMEQLRGSRDAIWNAVIEAIGEDLIYTPDRVKAVQQYLVPRLVEALPPNEWTAVTPGEISDRWPVPELTDIVNAGWLLLLSDDFDTFRSRIGVSAEDEERKHDASSWLNALLLKGMELTDIQLSWQEVH